MVGVRTHGSGLAHELQRSHRFVIGVLTAMLALSTVTSGYLLTVSQPRLSNLVELAREVRLVHEGMLDQETGLRGWLATGDPQFRTSYTGGRRDLVRASDELVRDVKKTPTLTEDVVRMLLLGSRWQTWAREAAATELPEGRPLAGPALQRELRTGQDLFTPYRAAQTTAIDAIVTLRQDAIQQQRHALLGTLLSHLVLLGAAAALTVHRRRRLRATVLGPIEDLHETITALRGGDLTARARPTTVPELTEIGSALGGLADEVAEAKLQAAARERRLASLASRFETVVTVGRDLSGSLSMGHVSATVTSAAAELLGTAAVLWLRGADEVFEVGHRSQDPHGVAPPLGLRPPELVARAAAEANVLSASRSRAYPLVLAGSVTGVLEVSTTRVDPDTEQVLGSLLATAAAALESARLHGAARDLADHDALTQLPNRRRFDADLEAEWERCRRYARPLSLVMLDLDHFKRLNDKHGHLLGDQVLREVARVVCVTLRSTDTAYRYGGEELVLLLRETGLQEATAVSERIRRAIHELTLPRHPSVRVSASGGVATRQAVMTDHGDLVAQADRALYEAKDLGRNRVVTAWSGGETLFHGEADVLPPTSSGLSF